MSYVDSCDLSASPYFLASGMSTGMDKVRETYALMQTPDYRARGREVLFAHGLPPGDSRWFMEMDKLLRPRGLALYRTSSGSETIRRVERGGLVAAVLIADERRIHGISLLSIIRSIDDDLPCCLVTSDIRRSTLQAALSLRATSVMTHPIASGELSLALQKLLACNVG